MNREARINLNLSLADFDPGKLEGESGKPGLPAHQAPDSQDEARFAAALARPAEGEANAASLPATPGVPQPFALFSAVPAPCPQTSSFTSQLTADMSAEVERLMVSDDCAGHRQVRLDLKDDALPGVSIAIQEIEGRLQVDFICRIESARLKLNHALPALAQTLAQRLQRPLLLRVQTDDEDDPCLLEALATA